MDMNETETEEFISNLYRHLLKRAPQPAELRHWVSFMISGQSAANILRLFVESKEYIDKNRVATRYTPGHYYSAIVDPTSIRGYVERERAAGLDGLLGINVNNEDMTTLWNDLLQDFARIPFPIDRHDSFRYYFNNGYFSYGDCISLWMQFAAFKPKQVIEIGSGFSSAGMLDISQVMGLNTTFRFIEPYPDRLKELLKPTDFTRCALDERAVQDVPISTFKTLQANDILFIDSTHVLKTGSDVHHELFNILPELNSGVIIHFHDIQFPFEYPDSWIFEENKSWNEIYAIRLLLMYNNSFKIVFWGSMFAALNRQLIAATCPKFLYNTGGSLWLKKL